MFCYFDFDLDVDVFVDNNLEMCDNDEDCKDLGINIKVIDRDCDIDSDLEIVMYWELVVIE